MFQSVILLISLAVIAFAGEWSSLLQNRMSKIETDNGVFEQKINEVVNDYDNLDKNNPNGYNELVEKLDKIKSTNVNWIIRITIIAIRLKYVLMNPSDSNYISLVVIDDFLEEIYLRNVNVHDATAQLPDLLTDMMNGLIQGQNPSKDIATKFAILKNANLLYANRFNEIKRFVDGLTLD